MAEDWFEELKREVDHFFATASDEEIRAAIEKACSHLTVDDDECLIDWDFENECPPLESQPDKRAGGASKALGTCNGSGERDHDFPPDAALAHSEEHRTRNAEVPGA